MATYPRSPDGHPVSASPVIPSAGALRPLGQDEVTITGGFWGEFQSLNADTIIGHCLHWMERIGWIGNFDSAGSGESFTHSGIEFVDSEIYKLLEAMAWQLGRAPDEELAATYDRLVHRVGAAQDSDGYLHTSFGRSGQPARYSNLEWGHELYCFGHLIQAAVARLRSGVDDELPTIARRLADHIWLEFGPHGREAVCGHPEIEVALAEFARATGERRYLELARLFIERRGTGTLGPIEYGAEYFQDDMPVRDAAVLRGHAVRALYLASAAVDVAIDTHDDELLAAVERQWDATVARRTYLTGGMGSHHQDEAFGSDFELPPDRAYAETCAAIGSNMLSWRLLLHSGDSKYADLMERTLLNAIIVSPRADGGAFYYTNTLHQRFESTEPDESQLNQRALASLRAPWFEVSCCPTNVARTLASIGSYFATADATGVQLHQYGEYVVDTVLDTGSRVRLRVESAYPRDGLVRVVIDDAPDETITIRMRVPEWARPTARFVVDGVELPLTGRDAEVTRAFEPGTQIELDLSFELRLTYPDPRLDAVRGQVAVERGPFVLALEDIDLPDGIDVSRVELDASKPLNGDSVPLRIRPVEDASWPYGERRVDASGALLETALIPYFQWANRGPSTMRVWIPVAIQKPDDDGMRSSGSGR